MGSFHTEPSTAWTFVLLIFIFFSTAVVDCDQFDFLQDIQLYSDVTKSNISQKEYTEKMGIYLKTLEKSKGPEGIPKLQTYYSDNRVMQRKRDSIRLRFSIDRSDTKEEVESSELKMFFPRQSNCNTTNLRIFDVISPRRRKLIVEKKIYLSSSESKWTEFDITEVTQKWISGRRNLGLELRSVECPGLKPLESAVNVLSISEHQRRHRRKRAASAAMERRTDCSNVNIGEKGKKPKCCRHEMQVSFEKLKIARVIQPKSYEGGFCKGRCPLNFNHATNHSRIQNLVHKLDRRSTPRTCCAPSKLEPLEILMIDPHDPNKLSVEIWDNMIVVDCACS